MGLLDVGENNCSKTGKFFGDALGIGTLGLFSGPTTAQCDAWKQEQYQNAQKVIKALNDVQKQVQKNIELMNAQKVQKVKELGNTITKEINTINEKLNPKNNFMEKYGIIIIAVILVLFLI